MASNYFLLEVPSHLHLHSKQHLGHEKKNDFENAISCKKNYKNI